MSEQTMEELRAELEAARAALEAEREKHIETKVQVHFVVMAWRQAHDKLAEELDNTKRALALAREARDDAQAFQMTGFY
jgi:outer membrane protein TolC